MIDLRSDTAHSTGKRGWEPILESVPDAMIVIDGNGIMQFFSNAAERQFGYLEREMIGKKSAY